MSDLKSKFLGVYNELKSQLLEDPAFEFTDDIRKWVEQLLDYNVPGGKLNCGLSVIDSYRLLKEGKELTNEEIFQTSALGWCIEWVGLIAANDGVLLRNRIPRILKNHFKEKPYYVELLELFNEVEFQTASGQMIDLITTHTGEKDLSKYTLPLHRRIVMFKTAYYSFYLPVACALLMAGENLDDHVDAKNILIEMGVYFQVQDDYLDCFADPKVLGKIGMDIQDFKCSWLVVKALERCNEEQKKLLYANYGKKDPSCIANVKALYNDLKLEDVYLEYEKNTHEELINSIESHPNKAVQEVLKSLLANIYKRKK